MNKIKVGYLPLYLKFYDDIKLDTKPILLDYMKKLIQELENKGLEIVLPDVYPCRIKDEFNSAKDKFNSDKEIVAVITQNLAYSPSLESIEALRKINKPLIVFDTTPDLEIVSNREIHNAIDIDQGIHGVQDLCNLLNRYHVPFHLFVGHIDNSNVLDEVVMAVRASKIANKLKNIRVGVAGYKFEGMGDFTISDERFFEEIGGRVLWLRNEEIDEIYKTITEKDIDDEINKDKEKYSIKVKDNNSYKESIKTGLAIRKWMELNNLDGITINFLNCDENGLKKMPFEECSKILERGKGYAGEGDPLTASLVASLFEVYEGTTFTEMFAPDWKVNKIFLSHMGEFNPNLSKFQPVVEDKPFIFNSSGNTTTMVGCYKKGNAVFVNLAPLDKGFNLILSEVEVTDDAINYGVYEHSIQGWMKPKKEIRQFLKEFSYLGGTHHSALVYNGNIEEIKIFGEMMGFNVYII